MSWRPILALPDFVPTGGCFRPSEPDKLYVYSQNGILAEMDLKDADKELRIILDLSDEIERMKARADKFEKTGFAHMKAEDFRELGFADERGLLGVAWHPDAAGLFFAFYSGAYEGEDESVDHVSIVSAFYFDNKDDKLTKKDEWVLWTNEEKKFNHNGGALVVGPKWDLYVGVGDGGGFDDRNGEYLAGEDEPLGNAQNLASPNGKILRMKVPIIMDIEMGEKGQPQALPAPGNPHRKPSAKQANAAVIAGETKDPFVLHSGLRNPWKISFDAGGALWVADVGQGKTEEVSVIWPGEENDRNFGWKALEGGESFERGKNTMEILLGGKTPVRESTGEEVEVELPVSGIEFKKPIVTYGRDVGVAVIGGHLYRGSVGELRGKYVFGDYVGEDGQGGKIMVASGKYGEDSPWCFDVMTRLYGLDLHAFAEDANGDLYALSATSFKRAAGGKRTGVIHKLFPKRSSDPFGILDAVRKINDGAHFNSDVRKDADGEPLPAKVHASVYDARVKAFYHHFEPEAWDGSVDIAKRKAYSGFAFSSSENTMTSRDLFAATQPGQSLWNIHASNPVPGLVVFPGGLPLYEDGKLVGGVGVSGDSVDVDEKVAKQSIILTAYPVKWRLKVPK